MKLEPCPPLFSYCSNHSILVWRLQGTWGTRASGWLGTKKTPNSRTLRIARSPNWTAGGFRWHDGSSRLRCACSWSSPPAWFASTWLCPPPSTVTSSCLARFPISARSSMFWFLIFYHLWVNKNVIFEILLDFARFNLDFRVQKMFNNINSVYIYWISVQKFCNENGLGNEISLREWINMIRVW